ncbi:hypothetical protein [Microvirga makkahensis]|uniref:hypothetical protein n=1 Tax=Microvirga makkahensis TaxID=1128670 RepID=UPI003CCD0BD2
MRHDPRVSLTGFAPEGGPQIRLEGQASIIDQAADRRPFWDLCRSHTRALFQTPYAPASKLLRLVIRAASWNTPTASTRFPTSARSPTNSRG